MDITPSHCCRNAKPQREIVAATTASMRLHYVTGGVHECMELIKKESSGFQLHIFYSLGNQDTNLHIVLLRQAYIFQRP